MRLPFKNLLPESLISISQGKSNMKVLNIHARSNENILEAVKKVKFKGRLGLATTIQHAHLLKDAQKIIPNSVICGQVLGCDVSQALRHNGVDAFLYIGSGRFHPLEIAMKTSKRVICANPLTNEIAEITKEEVELRKKRVKGAYLKFLSSRKVGIIVTVKSGQYAMPLAEKFRKSELMKNKESFIFLCNTLSFNELENYPDIECWVNTACPRIATEGSDKLARPMVNLEELTNNYPLVKPYVAKAAGISSE